MIEVSHVSYKYRGGNLMRFPDFSLRKGEQLLLLGQSGSGKTTLLHLIGGLLRGYEGSIKVDGVELRDLRETELDHLRGKKMGFVFQRNHLVQALTVQQNIRLAAWLGGVREDEQHIHHLMDVLQLTEKRKSPVNRISQGQAQRVAIARAVANKPVVILADEPTSALDDVNCNRVIRLLMDIAHEVQAALLIATHDHRLKNVIANSVELK
ncbi:MAG: ATP-binding cassette domain-containing protein [Cyclobacteriaceae bacterium]|nr:ATP-binding cassette domain-containing protein [Cyclobacteriaceae bacterium]MDW8331002.1 ATP-binding cassette domain-containing protein [Cyclobacteriaceae bacterium]